MNTRRLKVAALMTTPRYEAVWARCQIEQALQGAGLKLSVYQGAFYGQCMEQMLTSAVQQGCDVALTVDFDSIFMTHHVERILQTLTENDEIDAVAALQSRRGKQFPLFMIKDTAQVIGDGPIRVDSAHFGLTAIDCRKLRDMPHPWFHSVPDANGEWSESKMDDDVHFWHVWKEHGNSIYVDLGCSIGHLEEVVSGYDADGNHTFEYPTQWKERNAKRINGQANQTVERMGHRSDVRGCPDGARDGDGAGTESVCGVGQ